MDGERFDELAQILAIGRSRRAILGAVLAGALGAVASGARTALADRAPRPFRVPRRCGGAATVPCDGGCCSRRDACIPGRGCLPTDATPCGVGYCPAVQECGAGDRCQVCSNRTDTCGGECSPCPNGAACHVDADCVVESCVNHVCGGCRNSLDCTDPFPVCVNHHCGECEFDVECPADRPVCDGGFCRPCQVDAECITTVPICDGGSCRACHSDAECQNTLGNTVTCHDDGSCGSFCADGRLSGDETDVDCGGNCPPCADGQHCIFDADCQSGHCDSGICVGPCSDGVQNGDCGGSCPNRCAFGQGCRQDDDCQSGLCRDSLTCGCRVDADCPSGRICTDDFCTLHCDDGIQDGDESDIDCGGATCPKCVEGKGCRSGADCQSGICLNGVCRADTCANGIRDGDESDIDCGGSCPTKCAEGKGCVTDDDCQSGFCDPNTSACGPNVCQSFADCCADPASCCGAFFHTCIGTFADDDGQHLGLICLNQGSQIPCEDLPLPGLTGCVCLN